MTQNPLKQELQNNKKAVIHVLNKYLKFIYNKPFYVDLEGGCCDTKRRIDLRMLINNTILCIEVDEHQHKKYSKYDEYNPDKFIDEYNISKNPFLKKKNGLVR